MKWLALPMLPGLGGCHPLHPLKGAAELSFYEKNTLNAL